MEKRGVEVANLDPVEPAERRKREEHDKDTGGPLGEWVRLLGDIGTRGIWGCGPGFCARHLRKRSGESRTDELAIIYRTRRPNRDACRVYLGYRDIVP